MVPGSDIAPREALGFAIMSLTSNFQSAVSSDVWARRPVLNVGLYHKDIIYGVSLCVCHTRKYDVRSSDF